jgi:hypothetical protein
MTWERKAQQLSSRPGKHPGFSAVSLKKRKGTSKVPIY